VFGLLVMLVVLVLLPLAPLLLLGGVVWLALKAFSPRLGRPRPYPSRVIGFPPVARRGSRLTEV